MERRRFVNNPAPVETTDDVLATLDDFIAEERAVLGSLTGAAAGAEDVGGEPRMMQVEENLVWMDRDELQNEIAPQEVEHGYFDPEPFSFDTEGPPDSDDEFEVDGDLQQQFEAASKQELQRVVDEEQKREQTRKRELFEYIADLRNTIAYNEAAAAEYQTLAGHALARARHEKELSSALAQEEQALLVQLGKAAKVQRVLMALLLQGRASGTVPSAVLARVPVARKAFTDVSSEGERPSTAALAAAAEAVAAKAEGVRASEGTLLALREGFERRQKQRLEQRRQRLEEERQAEAAARAQQQASRQRQFEERERLLLAKTERELEEKGLSVDDYVAVSAPQAKGEEESQVVHVDELWATFEEEDRRRTDVGPEDELAELLRQEEAAAAEDGVRFLSEEESEAFIKATTRDPAAEEQNMAAFLADLEQLNLPEEGGQAARPSPPATPTLGALKKGSSSGIRMLKSSALKISVGTQIATGAGELASPESLVLQEGAVQTPFPSGRPEMLRVIVHTVELVEDGFSLEEVDPFVIIQAGSVRKKTCGLAKSQDSFWHDTLIFDEKEMAKVKTGNIAFTVAKKAATKSKVALKGELLGSAGVPLEQYALDGPPRQQQLAVYDKKGTAKATVMVTLHRCTVLPRVAPELAAVRPFTPPTCQQVLGVQEILQREDRHDDSAEVIRANVTKFSALQIAADAHPPNLAEVEEHLRARELPVSYQWKNYREETYLHLMTLHNQPDLVRAMAPYTDLSLKERNGSTCLHVAAIMGHVEVARALLECGANVNEAERYYKTTALGLAAMQGHVEVVRLLLQAGAKKDAMDRYGSTPLMKASLLGKREVVEALLEAKAMCNAEDLEGFTPLHLALLQGHTEVAMLLLESGARCLPTAEGDSPLAMVFPAYRREDQRPLFEKLLARTDLNERYGRHRQSLLHVLLMSYAGDHCGRRLRVLLREDSTDVNVLNRMGQSPLFYAVHFGELAVVQRLLKAGARTEIKDKLGNTLLHYCASRQVAELVVMHLMRETSSSLPKSGAMQLFINGKNAQGNTPLHCAYAFGDAELVDYLHACGASATAKNMFGLPPAAAVVGVRKRLLPFYSHDEEAPFRGCVVIGRVHCPSAVLDAWVASSLKV